MKDFLKYLGEVSGNKYLSLLLFLGLMAMFVQSGESLPAALMGLIAGIGFTETFSEPYEKERKSYVTRLQNALDDCKKNRRTYKEIKREAQLINYPIGTPVIYKGNDNEGYKKGVITDYKYDFPVVNNGEKIVMVMGLIRRDNPDRNAALDKLDGIDQWNVMAENYTMKRKA